MSRVAWGWVEIQSVTMLQCRRKRVFLTKRKTLRCRGLSLATSGNSCYKDVLPNLVEFGSDDPEPFLGWLFIIYVTVDARRDSLRTKCFETRIDQLPHFAEIGVVGVAKCEHRESRMRKLGVRWCL